MTTVKTRRTAVGQPCVVVIGSGTHHVSGISHYTHALSCALSTRYRTRVILLRRLIPRRLYPGASRVGAQVAHHVYPRAVRVHDGVDWYWIPSIFPALAMLRRERPLVVVLQWWTGAVAHTYLLLVAFARLRRVRVILEMHEVEDTGETGIPGAALYTRSMFRLLRGWIDGYVIHSEADREAVTQMDGDPRKPVSVIRHGPYGHYAANDVAPLREAPPGVTNLMYFGTIRPYKGLEDLVRAFDALPNPGDFWLTVIGETWENWTLPNELIATSPNGHRITFVNRYVTESEAAAWLAGADAMVLPYHRSSASGPLHVGMALGLPIAVTDIPALVESSGGYGGCVFFPAADVEALKDALHLVAERRGRRYLNTTSWAVTADAYERLIVELTGPPAAIRTEGREPARSVLN